MDDHLKGRIDEAAREAVREELNAHMGDRRYINLERVPLICQSIVRIDKSLEDVQNNITWGVRIVIGAVLLALLAVVIKGDL